MDDTSSALRPQDRVVHLVDDDADLRHALKQSLELEGLSVICHTDAEDVADLPLRSLYGVIVSDIRMPGMDGLTLMRRILGVDPTLPVVLITGHGDVQMAVEAMRAGAYDFIEKPFAANRLFSVVERALEKRRLVLENRLLRNALEGSDDLSSRLVGRNPAIQRLRAQIAAVADTDADVLITGETGTGKEVVARALHDFGSRSKGNFVAINCAALPADIFESELFGHEAGAFTGAQKLRIGKLEHANGGTVFLDEIESMPIDMQAKLLRAIEGRSIERLGSNRQVALDVRFVAATKTDLINNPSFRTDLYYRLNVITLEIPVLRERRDDIPLLFFHLAREARARYRREIPDVTPQIEAGLLAHDWPGNVRELRNVADRFVLGMWSGFGSDQGAGLETGTGHLSERVDAFERAVIAAEIKRNGGALKPTYESLGISRKGLYEKMRRLGLSSEKE
ncbi:two-component system C4-dicarboxylate transport response regulator DctD [Hoeflea halophila]|uniref:C4-dicarboxylate transport transcriptional regulatory protein DctD n=1 Tax=Hoeflea halophila TaxID=714899 RepID=A0A286I8N3_9HYPH|nr:sigma-54 dependent transcriptional regulator [Hoeflea halophila]SOE16432.1 two-component system C4-dicarboxylate transport response regulator DctD [Hoeflea halophila]